MAPDTPSSLRPGAYAPCMPFSSPGPFGDSVLCRQTRPRLRLRALEHLRAALCGPGARADVVLPPYVDGDHLCQVLELAGMQGLYSARAAQHGRCIVLLRGGAPLTFAQLKACVVSAARVGGGVLEVDFSGLEVEGGGVMDFAGVLSTDAKMMGLRGLGLDGIDVVEVRGMEGIGEGLRWVSLRGTKVGCLWGVVEGLRACEELRDAWFAGGFAEEVEAVRVGYTKSREDGGRMEVQTAVAMARESVGLEGDDLGHAEGGVAEHDLFRRLFPLNGEEEVEDDDDDDADDALVAVAADSATPLSLQKHYQSFLVSRLPNLRSLDNVKITSRVRATALEIHAAAFQLPQRVPPLQALLAARELGGATVPRLRARIPAGVSKTAPVPVPGPAQVNKRPREVLGSTPSTPSPGATESKFVGNNWALNRYNANMHAGTKPLDSEGGETGSDVRRMMTSAVNNFRWLRNRNAQMSDSDGRGASIGGDHVASEHLRTRPDLSDILVIRTDGPCCDSVGSDVRGGSSVVGNDNGGVELGRSSSRTPSSSRAAKRPALMLDSSLGDSTLSEDVANRFFLPVDPAAVDAAARAAAAVIALPAPPLVEPTPSRPTSRTGEVVEHVCRHTVRGFNPKSFRELATGATISRPGAPLLDFLTEPGDRPRQFEYSPLVPELLVYGTNTGDLVVLNQATRAVVGACHNGGGPARRKPGDVVARMPSVTDEGMAEKRALTAGGWCPRSALRAFEWMASASPDPDPLPGYPRPVILGLSWLHKSPGKFLAGTNVGAVHMYDVDWMSSGYRGGCMRSYDTFQPLTSIHINADDRRLVVSGYSNDVGLYDVETGFQTETLRDLHTTHINVLKFANHNPHILVTSSFDKYVKKWDLRESRPGGSRRPVFERCSDQGNVMVCFSPDDEYILVSAVDNEVRQYTAGDGRLERKFAIPTTGEGTNYTRSYYMNSRDYIITGSCKEDIVRIYNARTGQYARGIDLDPDRSGTLYVQSLRANPLRDFNLSALLACEEPNQFSAHAPFEMLANIDLSSRSSSTAGCTSVFA